MYKYLVTGGAGFIGSNIVKELIKRNEFVRVLDNFSTGKRENLKEFNDYKKLQIIEGDLRSFHIVRDAVRGIHFILHQGALPSVPRSIDDPLTTNDVNINGTLNILEAAKEFGVRRVIFASSSSVYGDCDALPVNEDMPIMPLSPYAISKYTGERYCQIYFQLYGLETVCLRYFNVFGPKQDPDSQYSAVIPKFIKLISNKIRPVIYGDGMQSRDFTFVENNVNANLLACFTDNVAGQVFNVACGLKYTLLELVDGINSFFKSDIKPVFEEGRIGEIKHSLADISKIKSMLNFVPKVGFIEGLEKSIKFFANL
jgi:UDP-glucose 4-epimerase